SRTASLHPRAVYEFSRNNQELQYVFRGPRGLWQGGKVVLEGNVEKDELAEGKIATQALIEAEFVSSETPFAAIRSQPSQLTIAGLKEQIAQSDSSVERRDLTVSLEKKYTTLILPFVVALFTSPFTLSLNRKGMAVA